MQEPAYQHKLDGMVPDQRGILVEAAYGDSRVWESLAALYRFSESDRHGLRTHIFRTYAPDGRPMPARLQAPGDAPHAAEPLDAPHLRD